jgi:acyl carrier protein
MYPFSPEQAEAGAACTIRLSGFTMDATCSICRSPEIAADGGTYCADCAQLLRWFRSYFADVSSFDLSSITHATRFVEDLGLDSLDYIDWLTEAESTFGIRIPVADAERMRTVGEFVGRLRSNGACWLPSQDIRIIKKKWGRREWTIVDRSPEDGGSATT